MQKKTKKGISLIVLVITIIVMIILAAAVILSLNNAGIIGNANKAVDETNMDTIKAEADLKYAEYIIDNSVIGTNPTVEDWLNKEIDHEGYVIRVINKETVVLKEDSISNAYLEGTIKNGDYVTYKATDTTRTENIKQYTLNSDKNVIEGTTSITLSDSANWRVLGINSKGELLLTLEGVTAEKISLAGKEGYFNGENILHSACGVFGKGKYATGARSITREDINSILNVDYSNLYSFQGMYVASEFYVKYGLKVSTGALEEKVGIWYINNDISITHNFYHLGNSITDEITNTPYTFINNYLGFNITNKMNGLQTTDNAYKMLFRNAADNKGLDYFVASQAICLGPGTEGIVYNSDEFSIDYTIDLISNTWYNANAMISTTVYGYENYASMSYLKPVVMIDKNTGYDITEKINNVNTWNLK